MALHQQGRLAEAESAYRDVLREAPHHFDALHLLGVVAVQAGRAQRGAELIARAIAIDPNFAAAHFHLGVALCALRRFAEGLASYDAAIALQPDYVKAHANRGVVLCELKRFTEGLASYDAAIALQPGHAEALNNRGNALRELQRPEEALASYDKAIALNGNYAAAHGNRGNALRDLGRFAEALTSYDRSLALQPDNADVQNNRGNALRDLKRFAEALASYDRAIALQPRHAEAYSNRANTLRDLARYETALASYDKAIALRPDFAEARYNQGTLLLTLGDYARGWPLYEWRKRRDEPLGKRRYTQPEWLGQEDIAGKTLFLHWEQGFGDTIQFCRYAGLARARGARVILSVQDPLLPLLKQLEPEIDIVGGNDVPAAFDCHCALMSLPLALGTTLDSIPAAPRYLAADDARRAPWAARLGPKTAPRIGLAWSGNRDYGDDADRSIDLSVFARILSDGAEWVSLQKEIRERDAGTMRDLRPIAFHGDALADFADTAALIDFMDLVVTVDTGVAHLAAAMGKPVWILLPFRPDFRWLLDRSDSPWYPSVRLFRQREIGDWATVLDEIGRELGTQVGTRP